MTKIHLACANGQNVVQGLEQRGKLSLEIDAEARLHEAWLGNNLYSMFLRRTNRRPTADEASAIGTLMGTRVRDCSNKLQPSRRKENAVQSRLQSKNVLPSKAVNNCVASLPQREQISLVALDQPNKALNSLMIVR